MTAIVTDVQRKTFDPAGQRILRAYSWPPMKWVFAFREFRYERRERKWIAGYNNRGMMSWIYLHPDETRGNFLHIRVSQETVMTFEKIAHGWLGRAEVMSWQDRRKSVLLIHLHSNGDAAAGLWDPGRKKFYFLKTSDFLQRPHQLSPFERETTCENAKQLPSLFSSHAADFPYLRSLSDSFRCRWGRLRFELISRNEELSWKITRDIPREAQRISNLPFKPIPAHAKRARFSGDFFSIWERKEGKWIATQAIPLGAEAIGIAKKAQISLSLYDAGLAVLTLEEESQSGEKSVHRLDPLWLSYPRQAPKCLSSRKLLPGQGFGDVDFREEAFREDKTIAPIGLKRKKFAGVMI